MNGSARVALTIVAASALLASLGRAQTNAAPVVPVACRLNAADTLDANFVRAGFGSLKQDDISLKITLSGGLQVTATPLDERIIRLLGPDSYRMLCQNRASKQLAIDSIASGQRLRKYSLWYVSFYAVEQGETRFSPGEFVISNVGRDFRPIKYIPLTAGFGSQRMKQRDVQYAIYVFDGQLDINQPLTVRVEGTASNTDWQQVLRRIEQERALVRSRAAARPDSTR